MPNETLAINLRHVAKTYRGQIHALRGIEMRVHPGEIFGLLGPNGAGKSTLVKIIMTVVRPTRAEGTVLGQPVGHKSTLARVGYLPESHRFPRYLTGRQSLDFFAALAKVPRLTRKRRVPELLELVGMARDADRRVGTYSKGMMQRVGLAQALVNDPDLVVLDEPSDGVDPVGRRDIRNILTQLRAQGKTVFINSHLLSELEMVCDRVAILVAGQVVRQGTIDELSVNQQHYEIELALDGDPQARHRLAEITQTFVCSAGFSPSPVCSAGFSPSPLTPALQDSLLRIPTTNPADIQTLIDSLRAANLIIRRVQQVRPSLEELFMDALAQSPSHEVLP